jgi:hypothetical protein
MSKDENFEYEFEDLTSGREPGQEVKIGLFCSAPAANSPEMDLRGAKLVAMDELKLSLGRSLHDDCSFSDDPVIVHPTPSQDDLARWELENNIINSVSGEWDDRIELARSLGPNKVTADYLAACLKAGISPRPVIT